MVGVMAPVSMPTGLWIFRHVAPIALFWPIVVAHVGTVIVEQVGSIQIAILSIIQGLTIFFILSKAQQR
jgi:hypothetical protein